MNDLSIIPAPFSESSLVVAEEIRNESIKRSWEMTESCLAQMALVTSQMQLEILKMEQDIVAIQKLNLEISESSSQLISRANQQSLVHEQKKKEALDRLSQTHQEAADIVITDIEHNKNETRFLNSEAQDHKSKIAQQASEIQQLKSAIASLY